MSQSCKVFYRQGCPCDTSPEFISIEQEFDRETAMEQTGCFPEPSSELFLPIVGGSNSAVDVSQKDAIIGDIFGSSLGLIIGVVALVKIVFKR